MKEQTEEGRVQDQDCSVAAQLDLVPSPDLSKLVLDGNKDQNPERRPDNPDRSQDKVHHYQDREDKRARGLQSEGQDLLGL